MKVGVVADDVTGAGDIGVLFARHGYAAHIFSGRFDPACLEGRRADVVILDTNSRCDPPEVAARKVREATTALQAWGADRFWKKTCSVFRGNVGVEFDAMLAQLGETCALAVAAFPRNGRVTRGGLHYVHGRLLAESEFARDPMHPRRESNLLVDVQGQTDGRVDLLPLDDVRAGRAKQRLQAAREAGVRVLIADTETQDDLLRLAQAVSDERVLLGSSALAEELPRVWMPVTPYRPLAGVVIPPGPVLVISGSCMPQSREQLRVVRRVLTVDDGAVAAALDVLRSGETVAVRAPEARVPGDPIETGRRIAEALAACARRIVEQSGVRRLIVLGGETSAAVCRALGLEHSVVVHEIDAGLPLTVSGEFLLVLKSGSFGGPDFVTRAIEHLTN